MSDYFSTSVVLIVAIVSITLSVIGAMAARKSADGRLWYVSAAFAVFGLKGILTGIALWTEMIGHETLETIGAVMELLAVGLLVAPFLRR